MNISEGGMELSAKRDYAPGSILEVYIPRNPLGGPRQVLARVAWTKHAEKEGWFRVGISIVKSAGPRSRA